MLDVQGVGVAYGDVVVLRDVSLTVASGELVALVGSNGAGKTTLLRTISGLLRPRTGKITFLGQRIDGISPHTIVTAGLSHAPEGRRLFPEMSVRENLEMGAYVVSASGEIADTMDWIFSLLPILRDRVGQRAGTLSGGEQQMLAIGRALMSRPRLLLLDEPSLGLAPKVVELVLETVRAINTQGTSVLLIEQNVGHALTLASRAYVLESGRIVMSGSGPELLADDRVRQAYLGL